MAGDGKRLLAYQREIDGLRFRRRSNSARELSSTARAAEAVERRASVRWSAENTRKSGDSKRSSLDADLDQDSLHGPRQKMAERARRQTPANIAVSRTSDFLPAELISRSTLFNTKEES